MSISYSGLPAFAQKGNSVKQIMHEIEINEKKVDSICTSIMPVICDSHANDSIRVEMVYLLSSIACDTCIIFLLEHQHLRFEYGDGISEESQANWIACSMALSKISMNDGGKWKLVNALLKSLHFKDRDNEFILLVRECLVGILTKEGATSFLDKEIYSMSGLSKKRVYVKNLKSLQKANDK